MATRALSPGKHLSDHLFFATRPSRRYRVRRDGGHLVAVRKESGGRFLVTRVRLDLSGDLDFDDLERLARSLWWSGIGADPSLIERSARQPR